jgi:hypothetical protein
MPPQSCKAGNYRIPPPECRSGSKGASTSAIPARCRARVLTCWNERIAPAILAGERLVIAAHGHGIRALVRYPNEIADVVGVNIPNGIPLVHELDARLRPIKSYYLGDAKPPPRPPRRWPARAAPRALAATQVAARRRLSTQPDARPRPAVAPR